MARRPANFKWKDEAVYWRGNARFWRVVAIVGWTMFFVAVFYAATK